jgi:uncharacterized protein (DUF983 family)
MAHGRQRKCPKCGGNLFLFNDFNGWYEQCLQCSRIRYLDVIYDEHGAVVIAAGARKQETN